MEMQLQLDYKAFENAVEMYAKKRKITMKYAEVRCLRSALIYAYDLADFKGLKTELDRKIYALGDEYKLIAWLLKRHATGESPIKDFEIKKPKGSNAKYYCKADARRFSKKTLRVRKSHVGFTPAYYRSATEWLKRQANALKTGDVSGLADIPKNPKVAALTNQSKILDGENKTSVAVHISYVIKNPIKYSVFESEFQPKFEALMAKAIPKATQDLLDYCNNH